MSRWTRHFRHGQPRRPARIVLPVSVLLVVGLVLGIETLNSTNNNSANADTTSTTQASSPPTTPSTSSSTTSPTSTESTTSTTASTTTTVPPSVGGQMVAPHTVTYPDPYNPGYSTISQLVKDSTFILVGTLGQPQTATGSSGATVTVYPIAVDQDLGTYAPRMAVGLSSAEVKAGNLSTSETYIFFWASDPVDNSFCVVGGVRGMFSYDPTSDSVTRISQNPSSEIPQAQSMTQFTDAVVSAETQFRSEPITNAPPACAQSATGISQ